MRHFLWEKAFFSLPHLGLLSAGLGEISGGIICSCENHATGKDRVWFKPLWILESGIWRLETPRHTLKMLSGQDEKRAEVSKRSRWLRQGNASNLTFSGHSSFRLGIRASNLTPSPLFWYKTFFVIHKRLNSSPSTDGYITVVQGRVKRLHFASSNKAYISSIRQFRCRTWGSPPVHLFFSRKMRGSKQGSAVRIAGHVIVMFQTDLSTGNIRRSAP